MLWAKECFDNRAHETWYQKIQIKKEIEKVKLKLIAQTTEKISQLSSLKDIRRDNSILFSRMLGEEEFILSAEHLNVYLAVHREIVQNKLEQAKQESRALHDREKKLQQEFYSLYRSRVHRQQNEYNNTIENLSANKQKYHL